MMHRLRTAALCLAGLVCPLLGHANTVTDWNKIALDTMSATHMDLLEEERAMAIMHIAIYEAANAAQPTYVRSPQAIADAAGASVPAAVDEAAYRTLVVLAPASAHAGLDRDHARMLAAIPDSLQKKQGIALGDAAAKAVLQSRTNDGADFSSSYTPGTGPGAYQPTSDRPMAGPHAFHMRPFALESYAQFRPPAPPALDSAQMQRDLDETASWGGKDSKLRTADQTQIALFHQRPGTYGWNSLGRQTAEHMDDIEAAHLMAALNIAIADSHLSTWDAKYTYNLWRPVTAIRAGVEAQKRKPDPSWTPLIATPMIPEYPCAHCGLGSAAMVVMEQLAGTGPMVLAVENNGVVRHYRSFRQYAEEESASRIYAGVHYRWSNMVGEAMGRQVGEAVLAKTAPRLAKVSTN
jgi:hypothetical protein